MTTHPLNISPLPPMYKVILLHKSKPNTMIIPKKFSTEIILHLKALFEISQFSR